MLKSELKITERKGLHYCADDGGNLKKFKPWLGDVFSFLYDFIMEKSIFPGKFGGELNKHYEILSNALSDVHGKRVLELATGSGSAVYFLPSDNQYTGTDISAGLLRQAVKRFRSAGFEQPVFYIAPADDLPFEDNSFDIILCILSLNFFDDIKKVFSEIHRVAASNAIFVCSVPVPERNKRKSKIRGILYSENELEKVCRDNGFNFKSINIENGTLLYFRAILPKV